MKLPYFYSEYKVPLYRFILNPKRLFRFRIGSGSGRKFRIHPYLQHCQKLKGQQHKYWTSGKQATAMTQQWSQQQQRCQRQTDTNTSWDFTEIREKLARTMKTCEKIQKRVKIALISTIHFNQSDSYVSTIFRETSFSLIGIFKFYPKCPPMHIIKDKKIFHTFTPYFSKGL